MRYLISFLLCIFIIPAHSKSYLCDIFKDGQKIATLPGALPDNSSIARTENSTATDPNVALAYTLCPQAGFKLISTQVTIPGLRGSSNVTKIQQFPDPACILACKALS